jgi:hypothetical protein
MCSQKLPLNLWMFFLDSVRCARSISTVLRRSRFLLFTHIIYNLRSKRRNVRCKCLCFLQSARKKHLRFLLLPTAPCLQNYSTVCSSLLSYYKTSRAYDHVFYEPFQSDSQYQNATSTPLALLLVLLHFSHQD